MKMVKSLLLGGAAGLIAFTGAQAADLPVKAKPVSYVKICDLYGAGYFYVPGTETCIKLGGYVRANAYMNASSGFVYAGAGAFGGANAFQNRANSKDLTFRSRVWITADARSQTAWGTLRSYYAMQFTNQGPGDTATGTSMVRGFIQFAGFTVGRTTSLFDLPDANGPLTNGGFSQAGGTTGPTGINAFQYTAQFGGGLSASIGIESSDQRVRGVTNLANANAFGVFGAAIVNNGIGATGSSVPEIVANIDLTQSWGSARIAGALHHLGGSYYSNTAAPGWVPPAGVACGAAVTTTCGHPSDEWGYAIAAGFTITQIPGLPGSLFGISTGYSHGASAYAVNQTNIGIVNGGSAAIGPVTDAIYVNGGGLQKTSAWYISGAFQYAWAPNLKSSIYGAYTKVWYNGNSKSLICNTAANGGMAGGAGALGGTAVTPAGFGGLVVDNCNPDFSYWNIGSRIFNWTPVQNLDIGLDVVYFNFNSAHKGRAFTPAAGAHPAGVRSLGREEVWFTNLQITRSFWP